MKLSPLNYVELTNGERLAYRKAGFGEETLILIHGNMSSSVHFQSTIDALKSQYTIYAPDMRGFGKSSYQQPALSLRDLANDLVDFMNILAIDQATLIGWSTGGGVALEMAATIPERIKKVFLVASVGIQGYLNIPASHIPQSAMGPSNMFNTFKRRLKKWNPLLQNIEGAIAKRNQKFFTDLLATLYHKHELSPAELSTYLEAIYEQRNYSDIYYNLMEFNMTNVSNGIASGSDRLKYITAPVVIMHGEHDRVVGMKLTQETKDYLGDQAKLYILDTGHAIFADDFEGYLKILEDEL